MSTNCTALVPVVLPVYRKILSLFPNKYFKFCFAYGSSAVRQEGIQTKNPMIDIIFVVDDSEGFHRQNLEMNPQHYSFVKQMGSKFVSFVQQKWPAKVYFNTLIPLKEENIMFKYGIVDKEDLINDLLDWDYLYLAGRLHKPVKIIETPPDDVRTALRINMYSALHAAFLILPEMFTERELYKVIASLSYNGDFRMLFGEDINKINNIVDGQIFAFRYMYKPLINSLGDYLEIPKRDSPDEFYVQDISPITRMYHLYQLPKVPQKELVKYWKTNVSRHKKDAEDILKNLANQSEIGDILSGCLEKIVFRASVEQSLKGIFTAGFMKSFEYSNRKISKMIQGKKSVISK